MVAATPFFSDRGCHIRIYNEMKYLKKNDYDVTLCTYHLGNDIEGIKTVRSINVPWYKKTTPGASWHKLYIDIFLLFTTLRAFIRIKPKIIHAHLYEGLLIGWLIKTFTLSKTKLVFDCQGSLAEEMKAYTLNRSPLLKPLYSFFKIIEKILLILPNEIFCSSSNSRDFIINNYHVDESKVHLLEDAVDLELFQDVDMKGLSRTDFGFSDSDLVFVYSGSLAKAKGVDLLVEAMPTIFEKRPDIKFMLIGYGEMEEIIHQQLGKFIESRQLVLTGRLSYFDLPRYLKLADYAVEPKKNSSESSGKLYNYISAGLPIICFLSNISLNIFGNKGIYIDDFIDILMITNKNDKALEYRDISVDGWEVKIKSIFSTYEY